jgi:uncharacterized protein (TIRG00374 family)
VGATKKRVSARTIFTLVGLLGLGVVVILDRHDFVLFWHLLHDLRWYIIVVVIIIQIGSYWVNGLYYRSILRIFSYDVGVARLFEGALATNFVNYVVPTAGLAGAGFLSQVLAPEVPRGESVLTQLMRYALSALSVLVMMPIGFALIVVAGLSHRGIVKVTLTSAGAIAVLAFVLVGLVHQEQLLRRLTQWLPRGIRRVVKGFHGDDALANFVGQFYVGYHAMVRQRVRMLVPFAWSMLYILIEMFTFYLAFVAFSIHEALGAVIMAYLFANIASTFGGVFFSTGTFELGMVGTLVALGSPFAVAFSVTIVYRVLNLLIGLPPGYVFYRKYLPS